jgi:hypothetical protein
MRDFLLLRASASRGPGAFSGFIGLASTAIAARTVVSRIINGGPFGRRLPASMPENERLTAARKPASSPVMIIAGNHALPMPRSVFERPRTTANKITGAPRAAFPTEARP